MTMDEAAKNFKKTTMPLKDMKKLPFTYLDDVPSDPDDEPENKPIKRH